MIIRETLKNWIYGIGSIFVGSILFYIIGSILRIIPGISTLTPELFLHTSILSNVLIGLFYSIAIVVCMTGVELIGYIIKEILNG